MSEEDKKDLEKAAAIVAVASTPEFKVILDLVEELREMYNVEPEVFLMPDGAVGDVKVSEFKLASFTGARLGLATFIQKIEECKRLIEKRAKMNAMREQLAAENAE